MIAAALQESLRPGANVLSTIAAALSASTLAVENAVKKKAAPPIVKDTIEAGIAVNDLEADIEAFVAATPNYTIDQFANQVAACDAAIPGPLPGQTPSATKTITTKAAQTANAQSGYATWLTNHINANIIGAGHVPLITNGAQALKSMSDFIRDADPPVYDIVYIMLHQAQVQQAIIEAAKKDADKRLEAANKDYMRMMAATISANHADAGAVVAALRNACANPAAPNANEQAYIGAATEGEAVVNNLIGGPAIAGAVNLGPFVNDAALLAAYANPGILLGRITGRMTALGVPVRRAHTQIRNAVNAINNAVNPLVNAVAGGAVDFANAGQVITALEGALGLGPNGNVAAGVGDAAALNEILAAARNAQGGGRPSRYRCCKRHCSQTDDWCRKKYRGQDCHRKC